MRDRSLFGRTVTVYHGDADALGRHPAPCCAGVFWQHGHRRTPAADGTTATPAAHAAGGARNRRPLRGGLQPLEPGDRLCPRRGAGAFPGRTGGTFVPGVDPRGGGGAVCAGPSTGGRCCTIWRPEPGGTGSGTGAHSLTQLMSKEETPMKEKRTGGAAGRSDRGAPLWQGHPAAHPGCRARPPAPAGCGPRGSRCSPGRRMCWVGWTLRCRAEVCCCASACRWPPATTPGRWPTPDGC